MANTMACRPLFANNVVSPSMFPAPHIRSISLVNLLGVLASLLLVSSASFKDYTLFAASTHRWKILMDQLSSKGLPTVKRMSDTQWSARADATKALFMGYNEINAALEEIAGDDEEKAETWEEAGGLAAYMNRLESGILSVLRHHILHRFHANRQVLQSADQDLNSVIQISESLIEFIHKL